MVFVRRCEKRRREEIKKEEKRINIRMKMKSRNVVSIIQSSEHDVTISTPSIFLKYFYHCFPNKHADPPSTHLTFGKQQSKRFHTDVYVNLQKEIEKRDEKSNEKSGDFCQHMNLVSTQPQNSRNSRNLDLCCTISQTISHTQEKHLQQPYIQHLQHNGIIAKKSFKRTQKKSQHAILAITKHQKVVVEEPKLPITKHQKVVVEEPKLPITKHQKVVLEEPKLPITKHQKVVVEEPKLPITKHQKGGCGRTKASNHKASKSGCGRTKASKSQSIKKWLWKNQSFQSQSIKNKNLPPCKNQGSTALKEKKGLTHPQSLQENKNSQHPLTKSINISNKSSRRLLNSNSNNRIYLRRKSNHYSNTNSNKYCNNFHHPEKLKNSNILDKKYSFLKLFKFLFSCFNNVVSIIQSSEHDVTISTPSIFLKYFYHCFPNKHADPPSTHLTFGKQQSKRFHVES
ncbi:hypothetical protein Avbf_06123 [Armadillidium vulgare]|nr:hypothetical protein Avbf_06123 [Armadillidium vulgare]